MDYFRFFNLRKDGSLEDVSSGNGNPDNNVNFFNIDMIYTWQFAQGSFINLAWKNAAEVFGQNISSKYYSNLSNTLSAPQHTDDGKQWFVFHY